MALLLALLRRILGSRGVRYGFVVVTLALGAWAIDGDWHRISPALGRIGIRWSLLSLAIMLVASCASMWTWRVLLAGLGSPLKFGAAARIMFVGQLGKYLPGSVWPVLAQMEMAAAHDVPRARSASAGLINMPVSLLSALLAALVTLPFTGGSTVYLWFIAATPLLLACLHPKVLNYLLNLMFKLARREPLEQPLTFRVIAESVAWSFLSWLLYGAALWVLAIRAGIPAGVGYPLAVGAFALGFALGFIVILAPAGAGIRDVVIIAILSHPAGVTAATATAAAVAWRAVTIAGDVTVALLALANRHAKPPKPRCGPGGTRDPRDLARPIPQSTHAPAD